MVLLHNKSAQLAMVAGNVVISGAFTNVVGGAMTAGTFDSDGSGLITYNTFNAVPTVVGTIKGGDTGTGVGGLLTITGATVSNAYVRIGPTPSSGVTVGVIAIGEAKL